VDSLGHEENFTPKPTTLRRDLDGFVVSVWGMNMAHVVMFRVGDKQ